MTAPGNIPAPPADRPPDPAVAEAAARETRRRLAMSRWPLVLLLAGASALCAVPFAVWRQAGMIPPEDAQRGFLWLSCGLFLAIFLVWPRLSKRIGVRAGSHALLPADMFFSASAWKSTSPSVLVFSATVGIVLGALLLTAQVLPGVREQLVTASLTMLALVLFVAGVRSAFRFGLPEFAYTAATALVMPLTPALFCHQENSLMTVWLAAMSFSALQAPVGVLLGLRWRRWLRSLPPEEPKP